MPDDFERMWADLPRSAVRHVRRLLPPAVHLVRARAARPGSSRPAPPAAWGGDRRLRQHGRLVARPGRARRRRRRARPARTWTRCSTAGRTTARWAWSRRSRRSTRSARAASCRPGRSGSGVRRGGGLAVRAGLPRLAAGRPARVTWGAARALRDRDGVALADVWTRTRRYDRAARPAGGRRDVRRAARRAGPRPRRPRRGGRDRQRDLAARAVPVRLHRRGQPRGHHADGGPHGPDADLRDDRAGRQQAGPAGRRAGHVRPARGRPPTAPTPSLAGPGLAGRPRRRRGDVAGRLVEAITGRRASGPSATGPTVEVDRRVGVRRRRLRPRAPRSAADDWPVIPTAAGHDAGILSAAGIPTAMLFVRNPTGVRTRRPSTPRPATAWPGSRPWPTPSSGWPRDGVPARAGVGRRRRRRRRARRDRGRAVHRGRARLTRGRRSFRQSRMSSAGR